MTVATPVDVGNRLGRPLLPFEETRVEALLQDIEVEIRREAPGRLTDPDWRDAVVSVECSMAIRIGRLADSNISLVPEQEGIGYPNNPTYQKVQLFRSDRRTLGLALTASVGLSPTPASLTGILPPFCDEDDEWGWCW